MSLTFTPPAPVRLGEDPFAHVFHTKSYLDGLWSHPPDYVEIRFGYELGWRFVTDHRMAYQAGVVGRPPISSIFGIPIVEDYTMPANTYTITFNPPLGA